MFKKTRLKIFALIVTIATVIIALMLSVIYIANANYNYERGISLLESYLRNDFGEPRPEMGMMPEMPETRPDMGDRNDRGDWRNRDDRNKMFRLSTFYSVQYDGEGYPVKVNTDNGLLYSEQEILEIANSILESGKTRGVHGKMPFLVQKADGMTTVAMIDNTMEMDNSNKLFKYSLIVGFSAWFVILILAWFFSKKIVNPLEQNDMKQKRFISDAGHELKTPIAVISANADLLAAEVGDNKWLANMQYENERMGQLVKQLLELVRAENMLLVKEHIDFSRLVSGGALPFEGVAFEKGFILNLVVEDGIFVEGNQNQLSQLVSILIDNAIEHGIAQSEVSVKLAATKNHAVLTVANAGEPIPNDVKEKLFERFYRMDEARTDTQGHYGLGLAIAKAVTTAHGGKISVTCADGLVEFKVVIPKA